MYIMVRLCCFMHELSCSVTSQGSTPRRCMGRGYAGQVHADDWGMSQNESQGRSYFNNIHSKMPTVRNARSLVTSRELPSGLQIWGKSPLNALFSVDADTDSASEESVKVIQGRVAHMVRYTYVWRVQQWTTATTATTSWVKFQNSRGLTVRNFKFNLSTF